MYDNYIINKNMNLFFLSGTIISKPDFKFFYNSKRLISKVEFFIETESGFKSSRNRMVETIKITAYNQKADFIYRELDIGDKIVIKGFLEKNKVIVEEILLGNKKSNHDKEN